LAESVKIDPQMLGDFSTGVLELSVLSLQRLVAEIHGRHRVYDAATGRIKSTAAVGPTPRAPIVPPAPDWAAIARRADEITGRAPR
jgi:hypothetical protein